MFNTRSLLARTRLLVLTSLTLLPLSACSADSINAVRDLLKEASVKTQSPAQPGGQTAAQPGAQTAPQPGAQTAAQPARPGMAPGAGVQTGLQLQGQIQPGLAHPELPGKPAGYCERVLIRVRWGQFVSHPALPVWTSWKGRIKTENAQLRLLNTIRYEAGDQILPNPADVIGWMAHTKPHFDGFSAVMRFDHDLPAPKLILNTNYGHKVFTLPELRNIDFVRQVDKLGNRFQIKTQALPRVAGPCSDNMTLPDHADFRFPDEDMNVDEQQETMPTPGPEPELAPESQAL